MNWRSIDARSASPPNTAPMTALPNEHSVNHTPASAGVPKALATPG